MNSSENPSAGSHSVGPTANTKRTHGDAPIGSHALLAPPARPRLPPILKSCPTSRASSRECSPRSGVSEAPSVATQAMARLAQYRAGSRSFKADYSQRAGLSTGDVVAFRIKGFFLAAMPVIQHGAEPDSVLHILAPSDVVSPTDRLTHVEVIRQGPWVGFRSAPAGDRFLQARRRGPHRMAFFSANLGTWEQWEVAELTSLDNVPWGTATATLRNRRMPTCELKVDLVRVGICIMTPGTSAVTPRSLPVATAAAAEEEPFENQNIRKMSGLLVHEWLNFVEKEKTQRQALEARVEQAIGDAAGLREWAIEQVAGVRQDVEEEVTLLLSALSRKSAALEDAQTRLTTRLQWGAALLEAKKAAILGRRVLLAWLATAARAKYVRNVASKCQERAAIRTASAVVSAWANHCQEQKLRQQRLRLAVRKMAMLKMLNVMTAWRTIVVLSNEERAAEEEALASASHVVQAMRLRWIMDGWRRRVHRASESLRLLHAMRAREEFKRIEASFNAWRRRVAERAVAVEVLEARAMASQRRHILLSAIMAWRVSVEDNFGGRLQLVHAVRIMARKRGVRALQAWRGRVAAAHEKKTKLRLAEAFDRRRRITSAAKDWREFAFERRGNRDVFVRFVQTRAQLRMKTALWFWRTHTEWNQRTAAIVANGVRRIARRTATESLQAWRWATIDARVDRHRTNICQRRHGTTLLRCALAGWRNVAVDDVNKRRLVEAFKAHVAIKRQAMALTALRLHASEAIKERGLEVKASSWYAGRLQARALWVIEEALQRRRDLEVSLERVGKAVDRSLLKSHWDVWWEARGEMEAERHAVHRFQTRRKWFALQMGFCAWRQDYEAVKHEHWQVAKGVFRISTMRTQWVFQAWRHIVAVEAEEEALVGFGRRRLERLLIQNAFAAWHGTSALAAEAAAILDATVHKNECSLASTCIRAWAQRTSFKKVQGAAVQSCLAKRAAITCGRALSAWRAVTYEHSVERSAARRMQSKSARLRLRSCFAAWQRATDDGHGERIRLGTVGLTLAIRHHELIMKRSFAAWRGRAAEVAANLAAAQARRFADTSAVARCAFGSWVHYVHRAVERRALLLASMVDRQTEALQAKALVAWQVETRHSARNSIVVLHRVERTALTACRGAFDAWRVAARARRQRRTALVRFLRRGNTQRLGSSFAAWREVVIDAANAKEQLRRCILRKKVAFRLFRQWYWESFDEDLQATLQSMFAGVAGDGNGAIWALEDGFMNHPFQEPPQEISAGGSLELTMPAGRCGDGDPPSADREYRVNNHEEELYSETSRDKDSSMAMKIRAAVDASLLSPVVGVPPAPRSVQEPASMFASLQQWFVDGPHSLSPVPELAHEGDIEADSKADTQGGAARVTPAPTHSGSHFGMLSESTASTLAPDAEGFDFGVGRGGDMVDFIVTPEVGDVLDAHTGTEAVATVPGTVYKTPLGDFGTPLSSDDRSHGVEVKDSWRTEAGMKKGLSSMAQRRPLSDMSFQNIF